MLAKLWLNPVILLLLVMAVGTGWWMVDHLGVASQSLPFKISLSSEMDHEKLQLYDNFSAPRSDLWAVSSWRGPAGTMMRPSNVYYEDGKAVFRSLVQARTGGEIQSQDVYGPGRYRASIKAVCAPGSTHAFFTYIGPKHGLHNEIDIEFYNDNGIYMVDLLTWFDGEKSFTTYVLPFNPGDDYRTYGFDWYGDRVDFFVDTAEPVWTSRTNVPQDPCLVMFDSWVMDHPPSDSEDCVSYMYVDWVEVSQL